MPRGSTLGVLHAVLIMAAAAPAPAGAQTSDANTARHYGHAFVSNGAKLKRLGGARTVLHVGFGIEWRDPRGLGLAIEAGPRFEDHQFTRLDDVMLSVDASYHVRSRSNPRKVVPFVDGGFSFGWEPVSDGQHTSFLSLGGGVTYWMSSRRGLRFELRDAVTLAKPQTGYHYLGLRAGYTWLMGRQ